MDREHVKKALMFGTVALFLCGIGDWLLGYAPLGGKPILWRFTERFEQARSCLDS